MNLIYNQVGVATVSVLFNLETDSSTCLNAFSAASREITER